jgi:hypothetical protein
MYLHTVEHDPKERDLKSVVAAQMSGWLYESHCWIEDPELPYKKCMWCEHKSSKDMQEDEAPGKAPTICVKNPIIESMMVSQIKDLLPAAEDANGKG